MNCVPRSVVASMLALLFAGLTCTHAATHGLGSGLTVTYKSPVAPSLHLRGLDGGEYDLSTMKGRVVVINFWATWCPPCIAELPTMQKLWDDKHGSGLEILAVNVGEDVDIIEAFVDGFIPKLGFPILIDSDGNAFEAWGVRGLPKTYIVSKDGRVIYEAEGGRDMSSEHIRGRLQHLIDE